MNFVSHKYDIIPVQQMQGYFVICRQHARPYEGTMGICRERIYPFLKNQICAHLGISECINAFPTQRLYEIRICRERIYPFQGTQILLAIAKICCIMILSTKTEGVFCYGTY